MEDSEACTNRTIILVRQCAASCWGPPRFDRFSSRVFRSAGSTFAKEVTCDLAGGLCRYRLHDLVQVDGRIGRTPTIRFAGRAGVVSDRAGEKLTDSFVRQAIAGLFCTTCKPHPSFAMLAPDLDADGCRYTLYVNLRASPEMEAALDGLLARNPQYAYCRKLGQLLPTRIASFVTTRSWLMRIGS